MRVTAPDGAVGPIEFRSPSQLSRYIGAELSLTDDGYFVTGDIGLMDDGELFVVGRGDEAIVVAGRNVFPDDIETRGAARVHPAGLHRRRRGTRRGSRGRRRAERRSCRSRSWKPRAAGSAPQPRAKPDGRRRRSRSCRGGSLPKTPSGKLRRLAIAQSLAAGEGLLARVDFG